MSEEEAIFDPTLKKKKKKKVPFDLDAIVAAESAPPPKAEDNVDEEVLADVDELEMFGKKKAKKKKKAFNLDELNDAVESVTITEDPTLEVGGEVVISSDMNVDLEFDFSSKKKKKNKKKNIDIEKMIADDDKENQVDERDKVEGDLNDDLLGDSDREYTYDELLQRAFDQLREKNPEMAAGEIRRFVLKPPQVLRIGSKKTAFANFSEICRLLHRVPNHVLQFLLAELGTSGSIDGNNQLNIKGRFQQKQIENVLRRYIKEYVTCHTCKSSDTILQKDARLYFLQCEQCNSRCSVAPIKSGYQAVANKQQRQAVRAGRD